MAQGVQIGDVLDGRFKVESALGKGAFGAVFKVLDLENDNQPAALKVLFSKYHDDRKMRQRFVQEAKLLERLEHGSIARAYHWCSEGDLVYLAMELVDGESLDKRCEAHSEEGNFIPKQGVAWMCDQLCTAVQYAHEQGIIHRDLKPRNVMVNRKGARPFVKVLDFGIAKVLVGGEVDPTTVGRVLGSVLYIAPEQILSRPVDHRCDVFSLGTILFELLTLRRAWARTPDGVPHPFHEPLTVGEHNNHVSVLRRIARDPRPSACAYRPDLAPAVDQVLHKALAIDARVRFGSAQEFAQALRVALLEDRLIPGVSGITPAPAQTTVPDKPRPVSRAPEPVLPPAPAPAPPPVAAASVRTAMTLDGDLVPLDVTAETPAQSQPVLHELSLLDASPPPPTLKTPSDSPRKLWPFVVLALGIVGAALAYTFGLA